MSVWLTNLADVLRAAGCNVIEETYNRGPYKGRPWHAVGYNGNGLARFDYILWHHDASPTGDSPGALEWMKYMEWAPAAAAWVCSGCNGSHASGTWHIYAAGLSNHAGIGGPWNPNTGDPYVSKDGMNAVSWGIETDHTYGESWSGEKKQAQLNSLRVGTAAVLNAYNLPPTRVIRHLDWTNGDVFGQRRFVTYGRKNDVSGLNMKDEYQLLADLIADMKENPAPPSTTDKVERIKARIERVRAKRRAAREAGLSTAGLSSRIRRLKERLRKLTG